MTRPTLEVADIRRTQGDRFLDRYGSSFSYQQLKAFRAIQRCRTAALGGHLDACLRAVTRPSPTTPAETGTAPSARRRRASVGSRHGNASCLETNYFHVVFTVPHELNVLALENPRCFYDLLFAASFRTPCWKWRRSDPKRLGAEIGVIAILHTWGQNLLLASPHPLCRSGRRLLAGPAPMGTARVILSSYQ